VETTSSLRLALWTTIVKLPTEEQQEWCDTSGELSSRAAQAATYQIEALRHRRPGGPRFHVAEHRLFQL
jgi:hypothetical protein